MTAPGEQGARDDAGPLGAGVLHQAAAAGRFTLSRHETSADLAPFLDYCWVVRWDLRGQPPHEQAILPHPNVNLAFEADGAGIFGVDRSIFIRRLAGAGKALGVRFRPGGFRPFYGKPVAGLNDRVVPARDVFGPQADEACAAVLAADGDADMVAAAERLLRGTGVAADPVADQVAGIVARITADPGLRRVTALADACGISERRLQRLFTEYVGVSPKWVLRRARLLEAARRADGGDAVDWAVLAHDLGYADQAHLTRDFTATLGVSPARYAVRLAAARFSVNGWRDGNRRTVNSEAAAVWASQSSVTDPGEARRAIDELPGDLAALREASSGLVFHYRAGGDFAENDVPAERSEEINARYADLMLARLLARGDPGLARERKPADRVVGCCRDATVLFLALARHKGIPARARVGFAAYFHPGWLIDHVVAEVWDSAEDRWRLVEPELDRRWTPELNGRPVDWLDLADDQFVTGPRAWQAARAGDSDPGRHVVDPGLDIPVLRGWPYLAHNVVHDLAAVNKHEMLLWDAWGMQLGHGPGPVPEDDAAVLDEICVTAADPRTPAAVLAGLGEHPGLRVPNKVTSFDPYGGPPREVTLREDTPR